MAERWVRKAQSWHLGAGQLHSLARKPLCYWLAGKHDGCCMRMLKYQASQAGTFPKETDGDAHDFKVLGKQSLGKQA